MNSCIVTIIKDEHLYLDEWIRYHLDIGFSHIFVFEDMDSLSHRAIADKYQEVTLRSVDSVLSDTDKAEAAERKKTKRGSPHYIYLKGILSYMSHNPAIAGEYRWVFPIDVDEFVTLESGGDINEAMKAYEGYDAVVLRWKCFGASGRILQPDYSKTTVVDAFQAEASPLRSERLECQCKSCYDITRYRQGFVGTPHAPSDLCNYCNTDYIKDAASASLGRIYIRHYITKSWTEYVDKLQLRGFMWGGRRGLDFFFEANEDLADRRAELISDLRKEVLVVMPYSGRRAQGREIELMLSGWRKNCKFRYHFVVIGDFDNVDRSKFGWVDFIDCPRIPLAKGQYTPHLDIMHKFSVVMERFAGRYEGFFYVTDDEYAIKPFSLWDLRRTYYHSPAFRGEESAPTSFWRHDKWKTRRLLDRENLPHVNYTTHFPAYFEFDKLRGIIDKYDLLNESYVFDDVYFNSFEHDEPVLDSSIRLGVWSKGIFERDFSEAVEDSRIKFVCNSVEG